MPKYENQGHPLLPEPIPGHQSSQANPSQAGKWGMCDRPATGRGRPKYENQGHPTSTARFKDFLKECNDFSSNLETPLRKCMISFRNLAISLCQSVKIHVLLYFQSRSQATKSSQAKPVQAKPAHGARVAAQVCDRAWEAEV